MLEAHDIIDIRLLQEICDQVAGEIASVVTIVADGGEIVASSRRSRIGDFHRLVADVMAGDPNGSRPAFAYPLQIVTDLQHSVTNASSGAV